MPLNASEPIRSKERAEGSLRIPFKKMPPELAEHAAGVFGIPENIPVDGMLIEKLMINSQNIRLKHIYPLLTPKNINWSTRHIPEPVKITLPQVFEWGKIRIDNLFQGKQDYFQAALRFISNPEVRIRFYNSSPSVATTIINSVLLGMLPIEVFSQIEEERPFVVIMQEDPLQNNHMGLHNCKILKLIKDANGIIQSTDIITYQKSTHNERIEDDREFRDILASASGVFFVLDSQSGS